MSCKAGEAGFTLVEVLIALVVAGLFLGVLGRAFATAWGNTRTPMEIVSAVTIARGLAAEQAVEDAPREGRIGGFTFERSIGTVDIATHPSGLAPPPSAGLLAAPSGPAGPAPPPLHLDLSWISVVVTTPARRRLRFDTVRLDFAKP